MDLVKGSVDLIRVVSELLSFRRHKGHIKHQEQNIEQLKLKIKLLYYMRDALKEEIMKELVRGEMPSREFRIWLEKGERIAQQFNFNDILKTQKKGSILNVSIISEQPKQLMLLEYEIVKYLERSPLDHGTTSDSPHRKTRLRAKRKLYHSVKKPRKIKSQSSAEEIAGAIPEDMMVPSDIVGHNDLVQQLKNEATTEAEQKEVNKEIMTESTLPSTASKDAAKADLISRGKHITATAELKPEQVKNEISERPTSPSSPTTQAAESQEIMKEPTSPSRPSILAADADLDTSTETNMATAQSVSAELKNEMLSKPTLLSSTHKAAHKAAEKPQMVHTLKNEISEQPTSPSSPTTQAAKVDFVLTPQALVGTAESESQEIMKEPTSPSRPSILAADADLDTSTETNMATAQSVSVELKNEMAEKHQMVHTLKAKSSFLSAGGREIASCEGRHLISPETRLKTLKSKKSIHLMVQKVLRSKAKIIGIYGKGGIGKTSVLKALIDDAKVKQKYDIIIWVTVSRCWTTRKIQDGVVSQLPFPPVDSQSDSNIAKSLSQALQEEKFLLILDDVWEKIDLNEVGIPISSLRHGCKLLMATRSVDVCRDMAAKEIEVESLSVEEASELFHEQVGCIVDSPNIQPYARGIINECGGLPLTIIITGKALAGETDVSEWKLAFKEFVLPKTGLHGIEPPIQQLKFSYDRLKVHARESPRLMGSDLQIFFLYCALFPEDNNIKISSLVEFWIEEGLIAGNLADAHKKGYDIVELLIGAALLESTGDGLCIRMHDTIRDLALGLLSAKAEGSQFPVRQFPNEGSNPSSALESTEEVNFSSSDGHEHLFRAGAGLTEPPLEKEWEAAKMISLEENDLSSLPERPNCPNLLTLCLQRNPRLRVIPNSFFDLMPNLKVLNMSKTRITSLPESISELRNLQQLNLRHCERLMNLPSEVGELKHLELLDLHGTVLNRLPRTIGNLESLKGLEVSFYGPVDHKEFSRLPSELMSSGILSKLHNLNNLSIVVNPGDQRWNGITESVIGDMHNLSNLTSLRFYFPKVGHLELFHHTNDSWKYNSLKRFSFIVGHENKRMLSRVPYDVELDYDQQDRCLRLVNEKMPPQEVIKRVLTRTTSFYLDHLLKISSLSQFGGRNIMGLEFCVVRECPEIEYIINGKELALPFLEHLSLHYLENLKGIWNLKDQLPYGSFASLKCLCVHTCRKLEFVFTSLMSQYIPNLEQLVVEDCQVMKDVISVRSPVEPDHIILPNLKSLRLSHLPNLVRIWEGTCWPSLEHISFYSCPKLKNLKMGNGSELKIIHQED